jgi:predicted transposase YbfD/YdcC
MAPNRAPHHSIQNKLQYKRVLEPIQDAKGQAINSRGRRSTRQSLAISCLPSLDNPPEDARIVVEEHWPSSCR